MSVLEKLATALNRRDEVPNQELARRIVSERNAAAVRELVENLNHKNRGIQSDCIKVLYEIGESNPNMIARYYNIPLLIEQLISCPNNQFPMYFEMSVPVIDADNRKRVNKLDKESQKKRVTRVLKKLTQ